MRKFETFTSLLSQDFTWQVSDFQLVLTCYILATEEEVNMLCIIKSIAFN